MADEKAKEDFNHILTTINRKFEVQLLKWEADSKVFEGRLKTEIPRDNEDYNALCDEWVDKLSEITNSIWVKKISNTGPKIRFRKQYQCWTGEGKVVKKEMLFDRTRCKGCLDLKVLSDNSLRKRNKNVKQDLNLVVKITFTHLHSVDTTQPYAFLVHHCLPQTDIPPPQIQPNARLPELVAAMLQNGPEVSRKAAEKAEKIMAKMNHSNVAPSISSLTNDQPSVSLSNEVIANYDCKSEEIQQKHQEYEQQHIQHQPPICVEVIGSSTINSTESLKMESHINDQQFTQFVVNAPQFDINDPVLMYHQPFVLDVPQFISLAPNLTQFFHIQTKADGHHQGGGQIL